MSAKSIRLCDCKVTELFWIEQEKSIFLSDFSGVGCRVYGGKAKESCGRNQPF